MQFIDLKAQQARIRAEIDRRIKKVLDEGRYIMGPEVMELEACLAEFVGTKHAIACASGTDALLMALMAYDIGPGDAVITTPFTFIATAEVISILGATPVFVDIDPLTFNLDPDQLSRTISAMIKKNKSRCPLPNIDNFNELKLKGIIAVDLFGLPADYERINSIAKEHGLFVIEDAAQSFGAASRGKKACSLADMACTSFFPAKPLGCYGDGGMCFTDNDHLADIVQSIRVHGKGGHKYDNIRIGVNGRLDTLQAAILLAKMKIFKEEIEMRNQVAARYSHQIDKSGTGLRLPNVPEGFTCVWAQYTIVTENKDQRLLFQQKLAKQSIPCAIYYPIPLHLQSAFSKLGYKTGDFPVSEESAKCVLSLPMHPYLETADQDKIIQCIME
jgi:dTDP-4-amino-4,6-dideoxygalactose transaminase